MPANPSRFPRLAAHPFLWSLPVALLLSACHAGGDHAHHDRDAVSDRIAPVGVVDIAETAPPPADEPVADGDGADETGDEPATDTTAVAEPAAAAPAPAAPPVAAAVPEPPAPAVDGKAVFDGQCFACHTTGVGNAPRLVRAQWEARLAQGKDVLYRHAIEGYTGPDGGFMPGRGGNADLSDAQVHAAVDWMLANLR